VTEAGWLMTARDNRCAESSKTQAHSKEKKMQNTTLETYIFDQLHISACFKQITHVECSVKENYVIKASFTLVKLLECKPLENINLKGLD
jgi:hypothetical protein